MVEQGIEGKRVLLPRSDIATSELPDRLRLGGAEVSEATAYRTALREDSKAAAREAIRAGLDAVTFSSSSTVTNLLRLLDDDVSALSGMAIACIGPATAATAGRLGLKVDIVSRIASGEGLADSLAEYFSEK